MIFLFVCFLYISRYVGLADEEDDFTLYKFKSRI
jgi:hypothetical protein